MYEVTEYKSAETLAIRIRTTVRNTQKIMLDAAISIGQDLIDAKELVAHGEWKEWVENTVGFSYESAKKYMQISREYGDFSKRELITDLSYTKALKLLAVPEEEREEFIKEVDVEAISIRELEEKIKAMQAEKDKAEKEARDIKEQLRKAVTENDGYAERENELVEQINELQEKQKGSNEEATRAEVEKTITEAKKLYESLRQEKEVSDGKVEKLKKQLAQQKEDNERIVSLEVEKATEQAREQERDKLKEDLDRIKRQAEEAAKKEAEAERKLQAANNATLMKFKFLVDRIQIYYKEAVDIIGEAELENKDEAVRFRTALTRVLEKMQEGLA